MTKTPEKVVHDAPVGARLVARVIRTLLAEQRWPSLADLTDAVKTRCRQLRIPYTNDDISSAYAWIETNTPLVDGRQALRRLRELPPEPEVITKADAAAFVDRMRIRLRGFR